MLRRRSRIGVLQAHLHLNLNSREIVSEVKLASSHVNRHLCRPYSRFRRHQLIASTDHVLGSVTARVKVVWFVEQWVAIVSSIVRVELQLPPPAFSHRDSETICDAEMDATLWTLRVSQCQSPRSVTRSTCLAFFVSATHWGSVTGKLN